MSPPWPRATAGDAAPDYKKLALDYSVAMKALSAKYPDDSGCRDTVRREHDELESLAIVDE